MCFCHYATSLLLSISVAHELFSKPTAKTTRRAYRLPGASSLHPPLHSYARPTNPVAALRNITRPTPRRAVVVVYDLCARPIIIITIIIITVRRVNYCLGDAPRRVAFPRAFFLHRLVDPSAYLSSLATIRFLLSSPSRLKSKSFYENAWSGFFINEWIILNFGFLGIWPQLLLH